MKNPSRNIVYSSVVEFLKDGAPIEESVRSCEDINQFVTVRKVTGGAVFDGELLGKSVRFYSSTTAGDECLRYAKNGNKVPLSDGCRPLMDLGEGLPDDLDYEVYETEAYELLKGVGYGIGT